MSLFFPEVFRLFPGSEGVSGGVLEDVFGIGEVTGGAFAPQAVADRLFDRITNMEEYKKKDDITILVLGIWDRY